MSKRVVAAVVIAVLIAASLIWFIAERITTPLQLTAVSAPPLARNIGPSEQATSTANSAMPASFTTTTQTSTWKTYSDKEHDFEIKYPTAWEVMPDYRDAEIIGYDFAPKVSSSASPRITIDFANQRGVFPSGFDYYTTLAGHRVGIHDLSQSPYCHRWCLQGSFIFDPGKEPRGWSSYDSGFDLYASDDFGKGLLMQILSTFYFLP